MASNPVINTVNFILSFFSSEWLNLDFKNLKFGRVDEAIMLALALLVVIAVALAVGYLRRNIPGRTVVVLPGIIPSFRSSAFRFVRHLPLFLFFLGLPLFFIALADPYASFTKETVTYPGRRIVMIIDASGSMSGRFLTKELKAKGQERFYTAVTAAEHFMQLRIKGKYKDLIGLVEFGGEAYVITPFTNDYENILMSIRMIGEPEERARFTDSNTIIINAINEAVELFRMFNFLNASGNLMVLISDGEDSQALLNGRSLDEILGESRKSHIPIYFIRTNFEKAYGENFDDKLWKGAVEKTGGKFYVGSNEPAVLAALKDIDSLTTGKINTTRYSTRQPKFILFAVSAAIIWILALVLWISFKSFRRFP